LDALGGQRKRGLAIGGKIHPAPELDTPPPRQYFPSSNWHSF
jgi:hypothetical protein